jgi:glucosamine 6-phosphate synthetase-like amidotransferase/phosphosugar isomerase protein
MEKMSSPKFHAKTITEGSQTVHDRINEVVNFNKFEDEQNLEEKDLKEYDMKIIPIKEKDEIKVQDF